MQKGWFIKGVIAWSIFPVAAVFANPEGGYLTYNNPAVSQGPSTFTTISYIFSLLVTFAIVVGLAYFTSKFLSRKWSPAIHGRNLIVHDTISLGVNKLLYLVEVGGKVLLIGVTDHNITHLQEFTDEKFMKELHEKAFNGEQLQTPPAFNNVFAQQIDKLQHMTSRFTGQREEE
jgi:flagellar protein FliO/FliZ